MLGGTWYDYNLIFSFIDPNPLIIRRAQTITAWIIPITLKTRVKPALFHMKLKIVSVEANPV